MAKRCVGCMKLKNNSPICEHCGYNENIPNESHQLPIGTVLQGRYQVGKKLGQGGFGITYIGWDQSLDSVVAIKEYYPNGLVYRDCAHSLAVVTAGSNVTELYSQNRERFLREAQILAELSHIPGIVRVQNLFTENNTAYIIMEYVDGITLKQYLLMQKRVMTTEELFHVMRTVMYALSKVHEAELVHRDISPDNIMIQKDGRVVLLDFGAARYVENAGVYKDLTHSTLAILKHGFAPIEQYRTRGNLGPWTDVYALCSTMYYCLTGVVPAAATERIMGDDNINWRQVPGLTAQQVAALEQGMAMLPEQRVGSIRELYDVLYGQRPVAEFSVQPKDTEPETVIETPTAPEVPAEKPVNKPAKSVGKKPVEYSSYTLNLEEPTPAPKTEMPSDPVPIVKEPKPDKKKKPVWIIAAVLAVMATAELFTMSQKDTKIVPETTVSITDTEGDLVPINSEDSWKNNLLEYPHLRFVDIYKDDIVSINFLDTLADAPQNSWDSSKENDGSVLAWVVKNEDKYDLYIAGEGGVNATGVCTSLFQDYINLETINFNDSFHSDNETYMINMFERCNNLISLDLSALDTSNVTNMASMFAECTSLTSLDFSGIDTSKVTNMSNMFADCTSLTSLDLSSFNTNSVTTMEDMFNNCSNLEHLSIHNFNTSNTEIMRFMFWRCDKLYNNIDLSSFDVSNVTSYDCFMNFGEKINGRPWEELFTDKNNSHANTEPTILATVTINSPISGCPELILSESYIYKGQSTYELSWKKFNDHSEYIVYVYERGNGNTTLLSQHHVTGLSYTLDISKFKAKGVYSVNISAGNAFSAPIIFMYT